MKAQEYNLQLLQNPNFKIIDSTQLSNVFKDRVENYSELNLYTGYFNSIPNWHIIANIDCKKANNWFLVNYKNEISDCIHTKRTNWKKELFELDDIFYFIFEDLLVNFDTLDSKVRFLFRKTDLQKVEEIESQIFKFAYKKDKKVPEISLLVQSARHGLEIKSLNITKPKLNIENNYNNDFNEIHQTILKRLTKKNDKGIVLLHGKPGTGKTSYVRYLISSIKKNVIFLPPNMASSITNPDLLNIMIENTNSIFVIEDAENIVIDRESNGFSPVSALLNISDGLLSDCLNIQIICSFNTDISKVDSALLRKGRLIAKYEFKELEVEKAQALSDKLGFKSHINTPMILTDIYNQEEKDFAPSVKTSIGFKSTNINKNDLYV